MGLKITVPHHKPSNAILDFLVTPIGSTTLLSINIAFTAVSILFFIRYYYRTYGKFEKIFVMLFPLTITILLYGSDASALIWVVIVAGMNGLIIGHIWRCNSESYED